MLKGLNGDENDRIVCLHLEVLFHEFSHAPRALNDSADKGFHYSSLSLAFHKSYNKKNEICK